MALHSKWSSGDLIFYDGTQDIFTIKNGADGLEVGAGSSGVPFKFYGNTASAFMNWDSTGDRLVFDLADISMGDTDYVKFGDDDDITMAWDTTQFVLLPSSSGSDMHFGSENKPLDVVHFGNITYRDPDTTASSGKLTLTNADPRIQFIDPITTGGTYKIVELPDCTGSAGIEFKIFNTSTGSSGGGIDVQNTGADTIMKLEGDNWGGIAVCDGAIWRGIAASNVSVT